MSQLTEPTTPEKPDISGNEERQTANVASKPAAPANLLECPPHNTQQLLGWLLEKKSDAISQHFIRVLEYLDKKLYVQLSDSAKYYINRVVQDFLYIMAQPEYVISVSYARRFVELNTVIANAVSMTPFENTDRCLDIVCHARQSKDNAAKVCALYSSRNRKKIDRRAIVSANPGLASLWYSSYMGNYTVALADPECLERMREHILFADDRLDLTQGHPASVYYGATYVDHENDRHVKRRINEAFQKKDAHIVFKRKPRTVDKPKIAVISDLWRKNHSACRVQFQFLAALKGHYHMTLVHSLYKDTKMFDMSLFEDSIYIGDGRGGVDVTPILENDFDIAYFPDVGMTDPSIRLANMRIAPIQILGPGHPVSTWGAQMDYFISGVDNELPEGAQANYSEKLLLLPGMGAIHNMITHPRKGLPPSQDPVVINCPWSPQKTNYHLLKMLAKVVARVKIRVIFRFFPLNYAVRSCGAVAFKSRLDAVLGAEHVDIRHGLNYASYMDMLEDGAFTIDSYPYGGGNVIADSLHMRRPIICLEGEHWYNRMGPAMLRYVGLGGIVAKSEDDFVDKMAMLVDNVDSRTAFLQTLKDSPVNEKVFTGCYQHKFKQLIDDALALDEAKKGIEFSRTLNFAQKEPASTGIAIIVPYRDRPEQLSVFIPHLTEYLSQSSDPVVARARLLVIEQFGSEPFNRGKLLNCGFLIAEQYSRYVVFHDVDYLPVDAEYSVTESPARLIWKGLRQKEDYETFFGGVIGIPSYQFREVNGFSNKYSGWGAEDMDLFQRFKVNQYPILRKDGTFQPILHSHEGKDADGNFKSEVLGNFSQFKQTWQGSNSGKRASEGLNSCFFALEQAENLAGRFNTHGVTVFRYVVRI